MTLNENETTLDVSYDTTRVTWPIGVVPTLLCVVICSSLYTVSRQRQRRRRQHGGGGIPGPMSLPLIGSLLQIGHNPAHGFQRLRKKYGDVFECQIGAQKMVIVSGWDAIYEMMIKQGEIFAARPDLYVAQFLSEGKSLSFSTDLSFDEWRVHRRLTAAAMRHLISHSDFLNGIIAEEASKFTEQALAYQGEAVNPVEDLLWSVARNKYYMCFGEKKDKSDADFHRFITGVLEVVNTTNLLNFFPSLRRILAWKAARYESVCKMLCATASAKEAAHLSTHDPDHARDVTDALIHVREKSQSTFDVKRLLHTGQDLIGAGLDIIHMSMMWTLLYLAEFTDAQRKVRAEIDRVVTSHATPVKEDMSAMPYTQAFIYESLRYSAIVPMSLPHTNTRDTVLNGVYIPKGSFVMASLYSIQRDAAIWGDDVNEFRPERFLDASGELDCDVMAKFVPCGMGRRKCVGDELAKQEMFIYVATLIQRVEILKPDGVTSYDLEPHFDLCMKPTPYKVVYKPVQQRT